MSRQVTRCTSHAAHHSTALSDSPDFIDSTENRDADTVLMEDLLDQLNQSTNFLAHSQRDSADQFARLLGQLNRITPGAP